MFTNSFMMANSGLAGDMLIIIDRADSAVLVSTGVCRNLCNSALLSTVQNSRILASFLWYLTMLVILVVISERIDCEPGFWDLKSGILIDATRHGSGVLTDGGV